MKTYTLNQRIRDTKKNKTLGYILSDKDGNIINVTSDQLKQAMRTGQVSVKGLTLTRDGRIFSKTEKVQEPDFSKERTFDINAGMKGIFESGQLNSQQVLDNFYEPAEDSVEDRKRQTKYKKYLSDMEQAIISNMSYIIYCTIGRETAPRATYVLVTKKYLTDDDKVTYIQGEKAACTAYANAIVQMIKNINKEYNDAVEYAYEVGDPEDDLDNALNIAGDRLDNLRDSVKLYIKQ